MQLDQTHVTIRSRTLTEISDLAMVMIRAYPSAILYGFAIGALPWVVLNALLLSWIPLTEYAVATYDEQMGANLAKYQILMALLIFLETPAAGVLATVYVGQAVFKSRPPWRSVFGEAQKLFWRWFWVLGVLRGPVPLMMLILSTVWYEVDYWWAILLALGVASVRAGRPFLPEILLLERCPLSERGNAEAITARRRSAALHRPIAGELLGRFIAMSVLLTVLAMLGFYSLLWLRGILFGLWEWDAVVYLVLYPLSLWAAGALSVLVRFLSYLDSRIRLEGWEVQLAVRAEAIRQFGESENRSMRPPQPATSSAQDNTSADVAVAAASGGER
ncbi:MAG: hypothetical protein ACO1RT_07795 [Planctomycetaceae bacterium]